MADDAGALLVRSGLVTPSALNDARARVEQSGGTVGEQLVVMSAISDDALTDFYRSRLLVPQVNPNTLARLPIKVIAAIPSDMAIELRAVPVAFDGDNNLTIAMSDPSDRHAVDEIAFFTGAYVVRAVATQMQIAWCLAHYYGHVTALGQRLMQTTGSTAPVSPPVARAKGLTGKVDAMRHRGVAPQTGPVNVPRPNSGEIVLSAIGANDSTPRLPAPPAPPPKIEAPTEAARQPDVDSDGVPSKPRARSISGEIRVPGRRAPSIRPPMEDVLEDDESGPVITVEVTNAGAEEAETGPRMVPVQRRRKVVKSDPPELYARAGEVDVDTAPVRKVDLEEPRIIIEPEPARAHPTMEITERSGEMRVISRPEASSAPSRTIEISEDSSAAVMITERPSPREDGESQPILLERRRPSDQPATRQRAPSADDDDNDESDDDDGEVLVLEARKPKPTPTRPPRLTQVGIGALPAQTARVHRDTEATAIPDMVDDGPTTAESLPNDDPTVLTAPAPRGDDTSDETLAAPPSPDDTKSLPAAPPRPRASNLPPTDDDDSVEPPVVPAHLARRSPPKAPAKPIEHDEVDDGWGPPGTTIPPPLLGAVPGTDDDDADGETDETTGRIPVSNTDAAPLIVGPAIPPQSARDSSGGAQTPARALEEATSRMIELIRALEQTHERDEVVAVMVDHLAETHRRAGFFVVKRDELTVFSIKPKPGTLPFATLRLDRPSTLADVVGTRLPYRGPIPDEPSRQFLAAVLMVCPPEILLVPVTVRERVVGVLFAENRSRHAFDDQLAFASRAAGMALERVLKAKRS